MIIAIHQPDYLPYIGTYYSMSRADKYVFLDDAQYSTSNMNDYNKIKTPQGECRIKIPVQHHFKDAINQVVTRDSLGWKEKHLKMIRMNYTKSRYFQEFYPVLEKLLQKQYENLAEMNIAISVEIARRMGITAEFCRSSDLQIHSQKEQRVIDICGHFNGTVYFSGRGAESYQREENFSKAGLQLVYTDYQPFCYPQQWGAFIPNLSIIDFIFNCGYDWEYAMKKIQKERGTNQ